jgi:hypothetical protein
MPERDPHVRHKRTVSVLGPFTKDVSKQPKFALLFQNLVRRTHYVFSFECRYAYCDKAFPGVFPVPHSQQFKIRCEA